MFLKRNKPLWLVPRGATHSMKIRAFKFVLAARPIPARMQILAILRMALLFIPASLVIILALTLRCQIAEGSPLATNLRGWATKTPTCKWNIALGAAALGAAALGAGFRRLRLFGRKDMLGEPAAGFPGFAVRPTMTTASTITASTARLDLEGGHVRDGDQSRRKNFKKKPAHLW